MLQKQIETIKSTLQVVDLLPELLEATRSLPMWLDLSAAAMESYAENLGGNSVHAPKLKGYATSLRNILSKIDNIKIQ